MKANELKKGSAFNLDGKIVLVKHVKVQAPSSRSGNTLYKIKGHDIQSGQKYEKSFKGEESLGPVDIYRRAVQFLYKDSEGCTFMDSENFEQYLLPESTIEEELSFVSEKTDGIVALLVDDAVYGIELPTTVVLQIEECAPPMKGASQSARTKPATMSTGLVVQVPEYLTPGEKIKINTESREFVSRA